METQKIVNLLNDSDNESLPQIMNNVAEVMKIIQTLNLK